VLSGSILKATEGTVTDSLTVNPAGLGGAAFALLSDGHGGTKLTITVTSG
jgi:hypothetical protein